MNRDSRAFKIWVDLTFAVIAPLGMLAVLLGWPSIVQLVLTVVLLAAAFGTRIVLTEWGARARRLGRRAVRRAQS